MSSSTLESVCWLVLGCYIIFFSLPRFIQSFQVRYLTLLEVVKSWSGNSFFQNFQSSRGSKWICILISSLSFTHTHSLLPLIWIDLFRVCSSSSDSHIGTYLPTRINRSVMVQCQVRSGKVQVPDRWYPVQPNPRLLRKPEMSTTIRDIVLLYVSAFSWLQSMYLSFFFVLVCVFCVIGWTMGKK